MSHGHDDDTMIDAPLDTTIDDVAREMTSLPARADLAARVTAHIEAEAAPSLVVHLHTKDLLLLFLSP